ncbi:MAG: hypothetical protein HOD00_03745 [Gemmatimonadales bacterium]|jgi:hypothetical protein|nr:hypothetical protein [Gemmatimonadales bacterium]MBT4436628.1 hypothetical protein [Gemmatimonadales bacterium]
MAAMPAHVSSARPARNWFHLSKGWKRHPRWKAITPAHRIVFYTLLDIANELWFPDSVQLYEAELADESGTSTRTVKRALAELSDVGVLHVGTVEEDADRRTAVRVRIDYDALTRLASRQRAGSTAAKSAECRHDTQEPQSECGSPSPPIQLQKQLQNCPGGQLRVPEMGGELREGDQCPKCQTHALRIRFKTHASSRTKQRFLACSGFESGECRGFTWNLGSSAYQPSQRVLSQALVGARNVPGRPPMVRDFIAAKQVEDASKTVEAHRPVSLAEWFSSSRYLPEEIMLDTLAEVDSELADRHRREGSGKPEILRDVKARLWETA